MRRVVVSKWWAGKKTKKRSFWCYCSVDVDGGKKDNLKKDGGLLGKRNLHEEKTTRRLSQSCARNATGGPRILFQVVSTDGLGQFLVKIQRVWRRRRHFVTANQSRIGNYFRLNLCCFFMLMLMLMVMLSGSHLRLRDIRKKERVRKKEKIPFSYAYVTSVNQP